MTVPTGSALNYTPNTQSTLKRVSENRAPTENDYRNFREGDEWLDKSSDDWWKLADINGITALWVKIGGTGGAVETFIPDSGTSPVVPDASNELITTGANGITVVGGTNTLTFTTTNGELATKFIPDTGTDPVVPDAAGEVTLAGGTGLITTGGLNVVTFDVDGSVVTTQYDGDTGSATPTAGVLNIIGGNGTVTSAATNNVTVEMESPFTGDFTFTQDNADETLTVQTTTSGSAILSLDADGAGTFNLQSVRSTDLFQLVEGATVAMQTTTSGANTYPSQPSFQATDNTGVTNVTGAGTLYTLVLGNEVFDRGGDYNAGTGTFTAPITGFYLFLLRILTDEIGAGMTTGSIGLNINAGGGPHYNTLNPVAVADGTTQYDILASVPTELTAGDTVTADVTISGGAGDSVDILAGTTWTGWLLG